MYENLNSILFDLYLVYYSYLYPSLDLWRTEMSVLVGSRLVPLWATLVPIVTYTLFFTTLITNI